MGGTPFVYYEIWLAVVAVEATRVVEMPLVASLSRGTVAWGVNPKETKRASLTPDIVLSSKCPIFSFKRTLSIVRICSKRITESFKSPTWLAETSMWVGSFAFDILLVMAAAITVGLYLFPTSFCTMSTGRSPPCSEPTTGLKSA